MLAGRPGSALQSLWLSDGEDKTTYPAETGARTVSRLYSVVVVVNTTTTTAVRAPANERPPEQTNQSAGQNIPKVWAKIVFGQFFHRKTCVRSGDASDGASGC